MRADEPWPEAPTSEFPIVHVASLQTKRTGGCATADPPRRATPSALRASPLAALSLLLAGLVACIGLGAAKTAAEVDEYQAKAAFLYNFTKYVKWPEKCFATPEAEFVVAVVGADPFGKKLDDAFKDKRVGTHPVKVVRWKTVEQLGDCHLLFVPTAEAARLEKILLACAQKNTLLVGESEGFARHKGCLSFFIEEKKMRFEVNLEAAKRAELELSPQLLKLARQVTEDKQESL